MSHQGVAPGVCQVLPEHFPHQVMEGNFGLPAQLASFLAWVAQQGVNFSRPKVTGIYLHDLASGVGINVVVEFRFVTTLTFSVAAPPNAAGRRPRQVGAAGGAFDREWCRPA